MKIFADPRKASTIAVIKNSGKTRDIDVLLMKRHPDDRFLPGYYVFPGGAVEEHDSPQIYNLDYRFPEKDILPDIDNISYFKHKICAVRETFEESGILFAEKLDSSQEFSEQENRNLLSYRESIIKGDMKLYEMMQKEKITPSLNRLHYLSRWITPAFSPIRYDTRFFVAVLPENQNISHDGEELVSAEWISPSSALKMQKKGQMKLVTPTIKTLEFLNRFKSADEMESYFLSGVNSPAMSF